MTTPTSTERAVAEFVEYLASVRRLSPHTVDAYRRDLAKLSAGAGDTPPTELTTLDLQRMITARRRAKPASIIRQLSAWRAFFDHLISGGWMDSNPVRGIAPPKKNALLPKALTAEEMDMLLPQKADKDNWLAVRDAAIMELLYSSALRLSELVQLNVADADIAGGCVHIQRGKGGRGRTVPLGRRAREALTHWLRERKNLFANKGGYPSALFVSRNLRRLTGRAIQMRVDAHTKKQGFAKPVSPHVFRHSCASHFLQSSGDLRSTQELLGHKDISTTQIYTRLDFQHLAEVYDKAHPRGKK